MNFGEPDNDNENLFLVFQDHETFKRASWYLSISKIYQLLAYRMMSNSRLRNHFLFRLSEVAENLWQWWFFIQTNYIYPNNKELKVCTFYLTLAVQKF